MNERYSDLVVKEVTVKQNVLTFINRCNYKKCKIVIFIKIH